MRRTRVRTEKNNLTHLCSRDVTSSLAIAERPRCGVR